MGMSYGATMALHWAAEDERISSVVAIAPYNKPEEAIVRFAEMVKLPVPKRTTLAGMAGAATKLELQWKDWSAEVAMQKVTQPVLFISGGNDRICRREDIAALEKAAADQANGRQRTKSIIIPEADHIVLGAWMDRLSEPIKGWFKEHLESAESDDEKKGKS